MISIYAVFILVMWLWEWVRLRGQGGEHWA